MSNVFRCLALACLAPTAAALAQAAVVTDTADLTALVAQALATNPAMRAARDRASAVRARVLPAGLLADPILTVGLVNQPVGKGKSMLSSEHAPVASIGPDPMTMRMVGIAQTIPYPGKRQSRRRIADREVEASERAVESVTRDVVRDTKDAWFELAFVERAESIVQRNRDILSGIIRISEARYGTGSSGQEDVLKARVEAARLAETAVGLAEQRRTALARLNAQLDRPSETAVANPAVPARIARAAVGQTATAIRFTSAALGARAADSPLPPLGELQDAALRDNAELREHEAMITVQAERVELARKEFLPDVDVSLQYGRRSAGLPDMVSAFVSLPIPLQKRSKQDQGVTESSAQLASLHAEHDTKRNQIRADVARLASDIERARAQLALYVSAILPQGRASLEQATSAYQTGRVNLLTLLDDQATLFRYETDYYRTLSDFAKSLTALERVVGKELLP